MTTTAGGYPPATRRDTSLRRSEIYFNAMSNFEWSNNGAALA